MPDDKLELEPCPFCGEYNIYRPHEMSIGHTYVCSNCFCFGPRSDTEAEARQLWNERVQKERNFNER